MKARQVIKLVEMVSRSDSYFENHGRGGEEEEKSPYDLPHADDDGYFYNHIKKIWEPESKHDDYLKKRKEQLR